MSRDYEHRHRTSMNEGPLMGHDGAVALTFKDLEVSRLGHVSLDKSSQSY